MNFYIIIELYENFIFQSPSTVFNEHLEHYKVWHGGRKMVSAGTQGLTGFGAVLVSYTISCQCSVEIMLS